MAEGSSEYSSSMNASSCSPFIAVNIAILEGGECTYGQNRDYVTSPDGFQPHMTITIQASYAPFTHRARSRQGKEKGSRNNPVFVDLWPRLLIRLVLTISLLFRAPM